MARDSLPHLVVYAQPGKQAGRLCLAFLLAPTMLNHTPPHQIPLLIATLRERDCLALFCHHRIPQYTQPLNNTLHDIPGL